ncbi:MAG: aldolase/citrate lyase family protein [Vicinamibacterales bacterium]|nr:aldolase/citrate lyase family protein [Vicinamibacterales bacterium]
MNTSLKAQLVAGRPSFGSWLQLGSLPVAEIMAAAGFDWLAIDLEHSAIGIETACSLIQVVDLAGCAPLVRLSANDPVQTKRVMDGGACGVIVPAVQSAAEARQAVDAVKYPPEGHRGVGLWRAPGYGARFTEYQQEYREASIVIVMIEHREGVEHAAEIVAVPGVDGAFIGPYDLSASYGVAGELTHPSVINAMDRVVEAAGEADKVAGIHVIHPPVTQVRDRLAEGFRMVAYGGDMLFLEPKAREALISLRGFDDDA